MARRTCQAVTGRDWASHRLLPSRDTEGAAISFMLMRAHTAAHSSTDTVSVSTGSTRDTAPRKSRPFHIRATAATTMPRMPIPQLSI